MKNRGGKSFGWFAIFGKLTLTMEEKLKGFGGRRVDINCGAAANYRGIVKEANGGLVTIVDEDDRLISISIDKIIAVTECVEPITRPGFIV